MESQAAMRPRYSEEVGEVGVGMGVSRGYRCWGSAVVRATPKREARRTVWVVGRVGGERGRLIVRLKGLEASFSFSEDVGLMDLV